MRMRRWKDQKAKKEHAEADLLLAQGWELSTLKVKAKLAPIDFSKGNGTNGGGSGEIPDGSDWVAHIDDKTGTAYYVNSATHETTFDFRDTMASPMKKSRPKLAPLPLKNDMRVIDLTAGKIKPLKQQPETKTASDEQIGEAVPKTVANLKLFAPPGSMVTPRSIKTTIPSIQRDIEIETIAVEDLKTTEYMPEGTMVL
eukprot:CAMPEP_0172625146 /NCGR_PEP_ID=MMETSP1068-20121228/141880_1 /TAXON_ID=35684 /ORGANISM="Pseudopedinella elastica, Strain CCMP716" /LENGTH=198 /DNA_ID=CAMNT_0013434349 /DNA_START=1 /DNA_END=597 /DNA_ORIENTATION=-